MSGGRRNSHSDWHLALGVLAMEKIRVKVKPNSKTQEIQQVEDGVLIVRLKSSPVDGKANAELIALLADYLGVSKSQITIKAGATSPNKVIHVT